MPRVESGTMLVCRLFEVADGIDLDRADGLLAGTTSRLRLPGERSGSLDLPDPPLSVPVGPREIPLGAGASREASASLRLFAHGVASVRYEVPLPPGADAEALAALVRGAAESAPLAAAARGEAERLADRIAPALSGRRRSPRHETYTVILVRSFEGGAAIGDGAWPDVARVLLGEPPGTRLSGQTVEHATRHRFSYAAQDLCVIDWDTALVVEPSPDSSVADVLEILSAQLLEFRCHDALLQEELLGLTALLGRPRASLAWLFVGRYAEITRRVQHLVVQSTEFVERSENAVQVVGDLFLARVYRAAVERFRVQAWEAGVLRRQQAAAQVADLLRSEANAALGHVLEASVVLLILLEIGLALRQAP